MNTTVLRIASNNQIHTKAA